MSDQSKPTLPKTIFIVGDIILVIFATIIAFSGDGPPQGFQALLLVICAGLGGILGAYPYFAEFRAHSRLAEFSKSQVSEEHTERIDEALRMMHSLGDSFSAQNEEGKLLLVKMNDALHVFETRIAALETEKAKLEGVTLSLQKELSEKIEAYSKMQEAGEREAATRLTEVEKQVALLQETFERVDSSVSRLDSISEPLQEKASQLDELNIEGFRAELLRMREELESRKTEGAEAPDAISELENSLNEVEVVEPEPELAEPELEPEVIEEELAEVAVAEEAPETVEATFETDFEEAAIEEIEVEVAEPEPENEAPEILEDIAEPVVEFEAEDSVTETEEAEWSDFEITTETEPETVAAEPEPEEAFADIDDDFKISFGDEDIQSFDEEAPPSEKVELVDSEQMTAAPEEPEIVAMEVEPDLASEDELLSVAEPAAEPVAPKKKSSSRKKLVDDAQADLLVDIPETNAKASKAPSTATTLVAQVLIGIGNKPYVRGTGPGLSEDKGVPMEFLEIGKWQWIAQESADPITCYIYKNDEVQAEGEPIVIQPGQRRAVSPKFAS